MNDEGTFIEIYIEPEKGWNKNGHSIAVCRASDEKERATARANARLIASSPELFKELTELVKIICGGKRDVTLEDCDSAKAVIAKAQGTI